MWIWGLPKTQISFIQLEFFYVQNFFYFTIQFKLNECYIIKFLFNSNRIGTVVTLSDNTLMDKTTDDKLDDDIEWNIANIEPVPEGTSTISAKENSNIFNEAVKSIAHSTMVTPNTLQASALNTCAQIKTEPILQRIMRTTEGRFLNQVES